MDHCYRTQSVNCTLSALFVNFTQQRIKCHADVSGKLIGPIFKGQAMKEEFFLDCLDCRSDFHSGGKLNQAHYMFCPQKFGPSFFFCDKQKETEGNY